MLGRLAALLGVIAALSMQGVGPARAHDIPDRIDVHAFVKPEGERLHLVARIPLTLLLNQNLPKRGPGFLDLAHLDGPVAKAAEIAARDLTLFEDGQPLAAVEATGRISLPSDRSFASYEGAQALIAGPKLPESSNVFWNQGYFDVHAVYPIRSDRGSFSIEPNIGAGLGERLTVNVQFLAPDGRQRVYVVHGASGETILDPRWYQAALAFVESGIEHILGGLDHLLFLLCLMIPFRRLGWSLVAVVTSFTVAHSITLLASAYGLVPAGAWFPPLVETLIAASIVYMAIENVIAPNLDRRWVLTGLFGLVHGFGFSFALRQELQYAGDHLLVSLLAFNVGVELGQVLVLAVGLPVLALLARNVTVARFVPIVLSVLIGHTAWHWTVERAGELWTVPWPEPDTASLLVAARVAGVTVVVGAIVWAASRRARRAVAPVGK
jgi:hypothetical protein